MENNGIDLGMDITTLLLLLIPLLIVQLTLMIIALIDAVKRENFKVGNKVVWVLVIVLINIFGPIIYFIFGKGDE